MKQTLLKVAVLAALGVSTQAMATGFVDLTSTGYTTTSPAPYNVAPYIVVTGANQPAGTTGWVTCNSTGNYGSSAATAPTAGANNTCAVFPANVNTTPVAGYASIAAGTATTALTGNGGEALATMHQRLFRDTATNTSCIYGKYFVMSNPTTFDYNPTRAGTNSIEVNDYAFGGFDNTATVKAGYYYHSTARSPIFRVGRSYTSVQTHNSVPTGNLHTGYVHRPINSPSPGLIEINGVGGGITFPGGPVPTAAQQTSDIRTNWVDFTTDVTASPDEDNSIADPVSSMMYVQATCNATAPVSLANSVILRQTGQESQPWITIKRAGLARSGANANP